MSALEDTDEYKAEHSKYVATAAVAERTGDTTGKLTAELEWERTQRKLERQFAEQVKIEGRMTEVKAEIASKYPVVPLKLLESITDPEALLTTAKELSDRMGAGDWGAPGGAPGGSSGGQSKNSKLKEINDLKDKVNRGDRQAFDQFRRGIIADQVMPQIAEWKGQK